MLGSQPAQRVQAIGCGPYVLGFAYGWARAVVEHVELTAVPQAPAWLLGAANLEGQIVPVVDLALWAGAPPTPGVPGARLLLGGQGQEQLALSFAGLPQPLLWQAPPEPPGLPELPERLANLALGQITEPSACTVLNTDLLFTALLADLNAHLV
jgi:hypothetical protein